MQIVINIPDEQVKKSLKESKSIHENEGEKGYVNIMMLYTNGRLGFVDVSKKEDFYSCKYKILPQGHGRLIDADKLEPRDISPEAWYSPMWGFELVDIEDAPTIIEADKAEDEE